MFGVLLYTGISAKTVSKLVYLRVIRWRALTETRGRRGASLEEATLWYQCNKNYIYRVKVQR